jgi:hypothetical protein
MVWDGFRREDGMIELRDKDTGKALGSISEEQLQFLIEHLEEESRDDRDYYLNATTLDALGEKGEPELIDRLRRAMGEREGMEIEWSRA